MHTEPVTPAGRPQATTPQPTWLDRLLRAPEQFCTRTTYKLCRPSPTLPAGQCYNTCMAQTQVVEYAGVMFRVEYEEHPEDPITFYTVHVLDAAYRPVGPNLVALMDGMLIMTNATEAEPLLSRIAEEITCTTITVRV